MVACMSASWPSPSVREFPSPVRVLHYADCSETNTKLRNIVRAPPPVRKLIVLLDNCSYWTFGAPSSIRLMVVSKIMIYERLISLSPHFLLELLTWKVGTRVDHVLTLQVRTFSWNAQAVCTILTLYHTHLGRRSCRRSSLRSVLYRENCPFHWPRSVFLQTPFKCTAVDFAYIQVDIWYTPL